MLDGRISVVIPCRDAAPWIVEALDSVARQSHPPQDLVIVDDGSTDGTAEVAQAWIDNHPQIPASLLRQGQQGLCAAMAAGVAAAGGELLCRLDADDRIAPDYLHLLAAALDVTPNVAYAYPSMEMFGDAQGSYYTRSFSAPSLVFQGNFVCAGALVRRDTYEEAGGLADLPAWEDWDLWLRLLGRGHEGIWVPEARYEWRRHGASRNRMTWRRRRMLRLRIWARHRALLWRYGRVALPMLVERARHPVRQQ